MDEQEIRKKLWEKASKEFDNFKNEQLKKSKEIIFEDAYKIAIMSDFTLMCEPDCSCLSVNSVKALLKEKYPVQTLYDFYQKTDAGGIGDLYESIWYQLSELQEKNNKQISKNSNRNER